MNYFSKDDFKNEWLGKSSNLGNNYNQCVTLYKEFLKKAGYPDPGRAIGGSGGAREIWYRRIALGYDQYFNFEQVGHPGDWFIWDSVYGWWEGVYYGHVAMLIKDNGNGTGQFLGMNQAYSKAPASIQTLTYNGSCGVLHFKGYSNPTAGSGITVFNAANLVAEHAVATLTVDSVAIREGSPTGNVLKRVGKGFQFEYYYKVVANGHRWVVSKDKTQFMAVSNSEIQGKDLWATFSAIEDDSKPSDTISLTQEDGVATFTVDGIRARYDSPTGDVCKTYNSGDKVRYYWKYVGNGHRYIVYKDGDRKAFVAVSATEDKSQMWATFTAPEEEKKEESKPSTSEPSKPTTTDLKKNVKGYGVDISEHNSSDIDLSQYDFVIIRASYGEHTDKKFEYFADKCEQLKIPYGVYCYDYALNDEQARAEAEYICSLVKGRNIQMGIWFDMEDADAYKKKAGVLTKERCSFSCKVFCDYVSAQGYYTGVYTSTSWLGTFVETTYPIWVANWGTNNGEIQSDQSSVGVMHQYSANPIDKNVIFNDIDFYKSDPKSDEPKKDDPKKDENGSDSGKDDSKNDKNDENSSESTKKDEINVSGINKLIEMLLKIVEKILKLFK
jgi:hypothetical protein